MSIWSRCWAGQSMQASCRAEPPNIACQPEDYIHDSCVHAVSTQFIGMLEVLLMGREISSGTKIANYKKFLLCLRLTRVLSFLCGLLRTSPTLWSTILPPWPLPGTGYQPTPAYSVSNTFLHLWMLLMKKFWFWLLFWLVWVGTTRLSSQSATSMSTSMFSARLS